MRYQLLFGLLFCWCCQAMAQRPVIFTQHMDNLLPVNPAFALFQQEQGSLTTTGRRQWTGVNGAPTSYALNGSLSLPGIGSAAGLLLMQDKVAVEQSTELNFFFAKAIELNEDQHLAVSVNGGFRQYRTDFASLDAFDPVTKNDINELRPNAGFGVLWYGPDYYLGLSVPRLSIASSQQPAADLRSSWYLIAGKCFYTSEDLKFKPSALVVYTQGLPVTAYLTGMVYARNTVGLGFSYNTNDEAAGILSFDLSMFHFGYSYQFGLSGNTIGGFRNATHELLLGFHFGSQK